MTRKLYGNNGELILTYHDVKFADVSRFRAELAEIKTLGNAACIGTYEVVVGYKAHLLLSDVTISDNEVVDLVLHELRHGVFPNIGFQGKYRRRDGFLENILFRICEFTGRIDMLGLAQGFVWDLELNVNDLTEEHIKIFEIHGI